MCTPMEIGSYADYQKVVALCEISEGGLAHEVNGGDTKASIKSILAKRTVEFVRVLQARKVEL